MKYQSTNLPVSARLGRRGWSEADAWRTRSNSSLITPPVLRTNQALDLREPRDAVIVKRAWKSAKTTLKSSWRGGVTYHLEISKDEEGLSGRTTENKKDLLGLVCIETFSRR